MKLNIPPISQKDTKWKSKLLGTSTSTIGSQGCLLCCHSMLLKYYNHDYNPDTLNELYKEKGVYQDKNLINHWKIPEVFPDITVPPNGFIQCPDVPAPLNVIDGYMNLKMPVIALVDFDTATQGLQSHFVLIVGKEGDDYYINDPWASPTEGSYFFSAKYGPPIQGIYGLRLYQGPVVIEEDYYQVSYKGQVLATYERNPIDKINELDNQLKAVKENMAQEIQNNASLSSALAEQEKDNAELLAKVRAVEKERDDVKTLVKDVAGWSKDLLGIDVSAIQEVRALGERLTTLQASEKTLLEEVERLKTQKDIEKMTNKEIFNYLIKKIWDRR